MAIANLLQSKLRETDEIACHGSHQLIVAMEGIPEQTAAALLDRLARGSAPTPKRIFRASKGVDVAVDVDPINIL